jgi:hypothetical protein
VLESDFASSLRISKWPIFVDISSLLHTDHANAVSRRQSCDGEHPRLSMSRISSGVRRFELPK